MAKRVARRASSAPSKADMGSRFAFPVGATVKLVDVAYVSAEEMGQDALKAGRSADDPVLKLEGEIEGMDETITEYLGAGSAKRLLASADGSCLEIPDGSTATGLSIQANAYHFLASISDQKRHGKMAVPEDLYEEDIRKLIGLEFEVGKKPIVREFQKGNENAKPPRPVTVAVDIITLPSNGTNPAKRRARQEEQEEDPEPTKPRRARQQEPDEEPEPERKAKPAPKSGADNAGDVGEELEQVILKLLASPKHRKGLDKEKAFDPILTAVRDHEEKKAIMGFVQQDAEFDAWVEHRNRPWTVDDDGMIQAVAD